MKKRALCPLSGVHLTIKPKILSWMKDVIPTAFGKVLKEEKKQGTFLKKAPMFFLKSPTFLTTTQKATISLTNS